MKFSSLFLFIILISFSIFIRFFGISSLGYDDCDAVRYHHSATEMYDKHTPYSEGYLYWGKPFGIYTHLISFIFFGKTDKAIFYMNALLDTLTLFFFMYVGVRFLGGLGAWVVIFLYGLNSYSLTLVRVGWTHTAAFTYFFIFAFSYLASHTAISKTKKRVFLISSGVFSQIAILTHASIINILLPFLLCVFLYEAITLKKRWNEILQNIFFFLLGCGVVLFYIEALSYFHRDGGQEFIRSMLTHRSQALDQENPTSLIGYLKTISTVLPKPHVILVLCIISLLSEGIRMVGLLRKNTSPFDGFFWAAFFSVATLFLCSSPLLGVLNIRYAYFTLLPIFILTVLFITRQKNIYLKKIQILALIILFLPDVAKQIPSFFKIETQHATVLGKTLADKKDAFIYRTGNWINGLDLYGKITHFNTRIYPAYFHPSVFTHPDTFLNSHFKEAYLIYAHHTVSHYHSIHKYIFDNNLPLERSLSNNRYFVFKDPTFFEKLKTSQKGFKAAQDWVEKKQNSHKLVIFSGLQFPKTHEKITQGVYIFGNLEDQVKNHEFSVFNHHFYSEWFKDIDWIDSKFYEMSSFFHALNKLKKQKSLPLNEITSQLESGKDIYNTKIQRLAELLSNCKNSFKPECFTLTESLKQINPTSLKKLMNVQFLFNNVWFEDPIDLGGLKANITLLKCFMQKNNCGDYVKIEDFEGFYIFKNQNYVNKSTIQHS